MCFLSPKEAATLDRLSAGRLLLGVGIGWMEDEFRALGIPFRERAGRTDETIRAMRSLWKAEPEAFESKYFRWGPVECSPKPVNPTGVHIVIGGHSEGSARRAARYGDGFFPAVFAPEDVTKLKRVIDDECTKIGRDPSEIEFTAILGKEDEATIEAMAKVGVTRLLIGYGMGEEVTSAKIDDWLNGFADRFIGQH